jgi:hypothetical protein
VFDRYETLFQSALQTLCATKEALKSKPEFNFDSADAGNLESGIAMLRVVVALRSQGFVRIRLLKPTRNALNADLACEKNGQKVCCEVKAITKQSSGRPGLFIEDQLYEKIRENISKARLQLDATATEHGCTVKIFACVLNWFEQSIYLALDDYQQVVDRLERDGGQEYLAGVDGVLFITKFGQVFLFLSEGGKCIDC